MTNSGLGFVPVADEILASVHGGRSLWGWVKAGAKWVKDHVVLGLKYIGIKGTF